jgi:hypothetical protein
LAKFLVSLKDTLKASLLVKIKSLGILEDVFDSYSYWISGIKKLTP